MKKNIIKMVLVLTVAAVLTGCGDKVKPGVQAVRRVPVTGIGLQAVGLSPVDEYYETSGTVKAQTVSTVAGRMMGTITTIKVREGERVKAGQVLLTIDDRDMAMKVRGADEGYNEALKGLEAARENMTLREITWQRYKKLYDAKALSRQELDQIETQKKVASLEFDRAQAAVKRVAAGVSEARIYQGYTQVKAPVSGLVTAKKAELGSMAVPGMPLLTIEDTSAYRIEVNADEKMSGRIRPGMEAEIGIESLGGELKGVVTDVVQSIDPGSRSFLVKISLKKEGPANNQIRSGLYARVSIPIGKKNVLMVPKGAVVEKGQLTGVYAVNAGNIITYRLVRTGRAHADGVEVLTGLKPGDTIVISGIDRAVDGGIVAAKQ